MENFFLTIKQYDYIGFFLMRLIMGFMFLYSSIGKMKDVEEFSEKNNISRTLGYFVVAGELCAGIGLILGLFTQLAALIVIVLMTGTMSKHIFEWKSPYWASKGGWEYDLIWFTMALVIFLTGGGKIAVYPFSPF
jgi:putative oxidoreductase